MSKELEQRVGQLESYVKAVALVAGFLGLSGTYLLTQVKGAHDVAEKALATATTAKAELESATSAAIARVSAAAEEAVSVALERTLPAAVDARFGELAGSIRIDFGPEQMLDYTTLDHSFDKKCPDGQLATGWGYGHLHNDARFFCRPVRVIK